ncbi:MAG: hypothetical protein WCN95_09065 [bacterium]
MDTVGRRIDLVVSLVSVLLVSALTAFGEPERRVYIGYVYPAGGQQGTTFEVKLGGEYIYGTTAAIVSGSGVTAEVIDSRDPSVGKDPDNKKKKKKNQAVIDEIVTVKITVLPHAVPGDREIRLLTPDGPSNPLMLQIGQLPEIREIEPNDKHIKACELPDLPVVVNGQILSGSDVDMFKFVARQGQHLVMEVAARHLVPYLADAVPGWFQPTLTLYDAQNREVAFVDDYRFNPDPVMFYDVPTNGEYRLAIRDSISRGRADFVYRIRIGELPFITSIFPLGAQRGNQPFAVKLTGRNLPDNTTLVNVNRDVPCVTPVSVIREGLISTPVQFAVGNLPEVMEDDTATGKGDGQLLVLPVVVNGRISVQGESDFYHFKGKKGERVSLEVHARRLGSPLDSCVVISNAHGDRLCENDDVKDRAEGLLTHQPDSELVCDLPEDGAYTVRLFDSQGKGGAEYAYRLSVGAPVPDFALRATPSSLGVLKGGSLLLTVHAIRRCGFTGEIRLVLDSDSAPGCIVDGAVIPGGTNKVCVTISAPENASQDVFCPRLRGTAVIDGKTISRPVVPSDDMMQAFIYQHLVPANDCLMTVGSTSTPFRIMPEPLSKGYLELQVGKEVSFKVKVARQPGFDSSIKLQLEDQPKGITLRKAGIPADKDSALVTVRTESSVAAGLQGNLILTGIMWLEKKDAESTNAVIAQPVVSVTTNSESVALTNIVIKIKKEKVTALLPAVPFRVVEKTGSEHAKPERERGKRK